METPHLIPPEFWESRSLRLALADGESAPAGLEARARDLLPDGGCLFRTSGSGGEPKWVLLEKGAFLHAARLVNQRHALGAADTWLLALPLHHVGGFSILARAAQAGSRVRRLEGKWDPARFAEVAAQHHCAAASLVPTQIHDLCEARLHAPGSLRVVFVGGAALAPELLERALDLGWPLSCAYGMTETAAMVASQPPEHDLRTRPDDLQLLDGWRAWTGADGGLLLSGPSLAKGWLQRQCADWVFHPIDPGAGFETRDFADVWTAGNGQWLRHRGRESGCLKILGELVHLERLEANAEALAACRAGRIALAIQPEPDARRGHKLWLLAERGSASAEALDRVVRVFNLRAKPFEELEGWRAVECIPRTSLGKIDRRALRGGD
jgi:O-succinylbenzoic acid--CoA ligase